ncbi:MAG: DUF6484 domain-containing protein [Nannocystaceae bacterium]
MTDSSRESTNPTTDSIVELDAELGPITSPRSGWLVGRNEQDRLLVDYPGNPFGAIRARTTVVLTPAELSRALDQRHPVLLLFEDGDPGRPIIVGLLHDRAPEPARPPVEVEADGRRVLVEAEDELVLRCGQASLVLRRNGRVLVRGTYVETRAKGVNRIKGGSVQIN